MIDFILWFCLLESPDDRADYETSLKKLLNIGIHRERERCENVEISQDLLENLMSM